MPKEYKEIKLFNGMAMSNDANDINDDVFVYFFLLKIKIREMDKFPELPIAAIGPALWVCRRHK